jgi:hypothetical protein
VKPSTTPDAVFTRTVCSCILSTVANSRPPRLAGRPVSGG